MDKKLVAEEINKNIGKNGEEFIEELRQAYFEKQDVVYSYPFHYAKNSISSKMRLRYRIQCENNTRRNMEANLGYSTSVKLENNELSLINNKYRKLLNKYQDTYVWHNLENLYYY